MIQQITDRIEHVRELAAAETIRREDANTWLASLHKVLTELTGAETKAINLVTSFDRWETTAPFLPGVYRAL